MKIRRNSESFEVELAVKPYCLGEESNYVSRHDEPRDVSSPGQFAGDMAEDDNILKGDYS